MAIVTNKLTKYYNTSVGCNDVSIEIGRGEIFGFLGPNGAGKSTVVKILNGLVIPTSGSAEIFGMPAGSLEVKKSVGYLPENFKYYDWLTGKQLLAFHASLHGMDKHLLKKRIKQLLKLVKLEAFEEKKIGTYSKGMQQRLGIASALLPDPDVLFFDEPTSALDPIGRKDMRDIMVDLKRQGKTVFLNSHLLSEMEMVCDSVAVIHKGSIIKKGKMPDILNSFITVEIRTEFTGDKIPHLIKERFGEVKLSKGKIRVKVDCDDDINDIARIIINNGGKLYGIICEKMNLEDLFISILEGG